MALRSTLALVIRRIEYGETSQIVSLLTPDLGRVDAIAKGSRAIWEKGPPKSRPRIEGPIDSMSLNRVSLYDKKGDALWLVGECEIVSTFADARRSLDRWHAALAVQELTRYAAEPGSPSQQLFYAAGRAMTELAGDADPRLGLLDFLARYLTALGQAPAVDRCAATGRPFPTQESGRPVVVSLRDAVVYDATEAPAILPGGRAQLTVLHLEVLRRFLAGIQKPLDTIRLPDDILLPLGMLLRSLVLGAIDRNPISFRYLRWTAEREPDERTAPTGASSSGRFRGE